MGKRKKIIWIILILVLVVLVGFFIFSEKKIIIDKTNLTLQTLSAAEKIVNFLPIKEDTKKEVETVNFLAQELAKSDGIERRYLILLQNNMELRPGGGFLGQYAILKIKDGKVTSTFIEDANLLDQRINVKVAPPYPFYRMMSLKKWKFRDSNFSPDFPTNVEKAKYFYRLSGGNSEFDGVISVNATVLNKILQITGPITVGGTQFNSDNAVLALEEKVEKVYILNENIDTQNRKWLIKELGNQIISKLMQLGNIPKLAEFGLEELRNKEIMLNFSNQQLQDKVKEVHWDGSVLTDWNGDFLMMVDANMGALKSDYYIKRDVYYEVDLSGEKPTAYLRITYNHTASHGDWRTSDYHSYLRVYTPLGSNLVERKMVSYPNIQEEFGKTAIGFILHVLIGRQTVAEIRYELPESVRENYKLLIQKQSGVGDIPLEVKIKDKDGKEHVVKETLKKDLKIEPSEEQQ